ncbi:MAG: hypothetical protein J3Q66DRAFT_394411 [Benniella sp.]|nr:MAG: hypothetical protein J3Q66DRAFT_394411 [Benniella sp.]
MDEHPLLIPEICHLISRFIPLKDAISCASVCKAWNKPFTSVLWHTIDFSVHKRFTKLRRAAVRRNGNHIRVVKNLRSVRELVALHHSSVKRLQSVTITLDKSMCFQAYCVDLLRQNVSSLSYLALVSEGMTEQAFDFSPIDVMSPPPGSHSRLTHIDIPHLTLTRDRFSSFLRKSPSLVTLKVQQIVIYTNGCSDVFQHPGLKSLEIPLVPLFQPILDSPTASSLLAHFPCVEDLKVFHPREGGSSLQALSTMKMRDEVVSWCPYLTRIHADAPAPILTMLFGGVFLDLESIHVPPDELTSDVIMAILSHKDTLISIGQFDPPNSNMEQNEILTLPLIESVPRWTFQLVPVVCTQLTVLYFPLAQMDIYEVERVKWSCVHLKTLAIRFIDLDTKDKIELAYQLWAEGIVFRKGQDWMERNMVVDNDDDVIYISDDDEEDDINHSDNHGTSQSDMNQRMITKIIERTRSWISTPNSIEERIARYLLQFVELKSVCLGHGFREVPL